MFLIIWQYHVEDVNEEAFRIAYGPAGDWARFFSADPGFEGVELIASEEPGAYLTIDRWADQASYDGFMATRSEEYRALDTALAGLAGSETLVGRGRSLPAT